MGIWGFVLHAVNFVLPAVVVAALLAALWWRGRGNRRQPALRLWGLLTGVGSAVLLAGLVLFGRDGKMLTHAGLVLGLGSVMAWWATRRG